MKETIYTAFITPEIVRLYPEFEEFYLDFKVQAELAGYEVIKLPFSDIWVRDFLPVQNMKNGALHTLFYDPTFKRGRYKNFYAKLRVETAAEFPDARPLPVRMDGGNLIVNNDGLAFAFEKRSIVRNTSYAEVSALLKERLGLKDIVWLPRQPELYDPFCHIDGWGQFLGNDMLLISEPCDDVTEKHFNKCVKNIKSKYPSLGIETLPVGVVAEKDPGAKGLYANYLETSAHIFVPKYNLPEDDAAANKIKSLTTKKVVQINCEGISKHGGSLHCLTNILFV